MNSSIDVASGHLALTATAQQSIDAFVGAFAAAVAGGKLGGIAGAGAGARATNGISMNVTAAIDGDGPSGIHADGITLQATDTSSIEAVTGAAALAISFGKAGALSIAVGVALAENVIQNDVQAYIAHANNLTTTGTGAVSVLASETARIDSTTFAASAAIAVGKISFAAAVGVLEATNTLANNVAAYISDSGSIASAGAVTVSANDLSVISADTFSLAVAIGVIGVGVGTGSGNNTITDNVSAYVDNSMITTTAGDIIVTATSTPSITTTSTTVAVSLAIGAAVAVFDATTTVQGTTEAYLQNAVLTATGHAIEVTSTSTETLSPVVRGGAGGLIAVGVMLSEATVKGQTLARLAGQTTVTADSLTVTAHDTSMATPVTNVGSVGAVAVSHAKTDATLERRTEASIPENARITLASGSLIVQAQSASTAYTSSRSDGGGAIAVSNLDINSTVNTVTRATVANGAAILVPSANTTGDVSITATSQNLAIANTVNYGGGGVNVQNSTPTATDKSTTEALMLGDVTGPDGADSGALDLVVRATANDRSLAGSDTRGGGLVQVGIANVKANTTPTVNARDRWHGRGPQRHHCSKPTRGRMPTRRMTAQAAEWWQSPTCTPRSISSRR